MANPIQIDAETRRNNLKVALTLAENSLRDERQARVTAEQKLHIFQSTYADPIARVDELREDLEKQETNHKRVTTRFKNEKDRYKEALEKIQEAVGTSTEAYKIAKEALK